MRKVYLLVFIFSTFSNFLFSQTSVDTTSSIVKVNEIFVIGNKKTHQDIILREVSFKKGGTYNLQDLNNSLAQDKKNIYNTNLFNEVDIQVLETADSIVDVLISVDERWYFYPGFYLRLSDRNFMDWLGNRSGEINRFNYGLRLDKYNFRGRNERLIFIGQIGFEKRFLFSYVIPYIEKTQKHGLMFDFGYNQRENMPYRTVDHVEDFIYKKKDTFEVEKEINRQTWGVAVTHSYRPTIFDFHYTTLTYHAGAISDTIALLNPNYFGNGRKHQDYLSLTYIYTNDRRNKKAYPTEGRYFILELEKKGLGIINDVNLFTAEATYNKYINLGKGFFLANGLTALKTFPNDQPYFNYQRLGDYEMLVKGFERNVIEGNSYVLSKNSVRKLFFQTESDISNIMPIKQFSKFRMAVYGKLFADFAWVDNYPAYKLNTRLSNSLIHSFGLGFDIVTMYDLVLRLEYSYNSEKEFNYAINIKADI